MVEGEALEKILVNRVDTKETDLEFGLKSQVATEKFVRLKLEEDAVGVRMLIEELEGS